jgi:hypothetical protein
VNCGQSKRRGLGTPPICHTSRCSGR